MAVAPVAQLAGVLPPPSALLSPSGSTIGLLEAISAGCTVGYVVAVQRTGAVFASLYTTPLTIARVPWAMLLLGETPTVRVWAALACTVGGLVLVRPGEPDLAREPRPA